MESSTHNFFLAAINQQVKQLSSLAKLELSLRYMDLIENNPESKWIYFMDDDLLDLKVLTSIPLGYAFRLWRKVTSKRKFILSTCSELWVSTPYLAKKYAAWNPRLIRPVASGPLLERKWPSSLNYVSRSASTPPRLAPSLPHTHLLLQSTSSASSTASTLDTVRICYHGTWSHRDDMKWLAPVIAEVQQLCTNTVFEVIGDHRVARIFRGIPRVIVLPTMPWPDYLKHTQTVRQDIGLSPLRDTLFNRGRGPIKFFDYARAGAVGVYSAGPAFSDFVSHEIDGFVLANDSSLWTERIIELVNSPALREKIYTAAWDKVLDNSPASPKIQTYLKELEDALI